MLNFDRNTNLKPFIEYIENFNINDIPLSVLSEWYIDYENIFDFTNDTCRSEFLNENHEFLYEEFTANDNKVYSVHDAVNTLVNIYKMDNNQFKVYDPFNVTIVSVKEIPDFISFPYSAFIPLINRNVEIIDTEMKCAGYYHAADKKYKDANGNSWINIIYDPIVQETVTEQVRNKKRYLYHCSPSENDESIKQNGLTVKNEKCVYTFIQSRIYMHTVEPENTWFRQMMSNIHQIYKLL